MTFMLQLFCWSQLCIIDFVMWETTDKPFNRINHIVSVPKDHWKTFIIGLIWTIDNLSTSPIPTEQTETGPDLCQSLQNHKRWGNYHFPLSHFIKWRRCLLYRMSEKNVNIFHQLKQYDETQTKVCNYVILNIFKWIDSVYLMREQ